MPKLLLKIVFLACMAQAFPLVAAPRGPLPPEVEAALDAARVPRESLVVVAQEIGNPTARLAWQPRAPVNPASLMKLVTTTAGLDLLGPAWTWTTPVWIQGRLHAGVLEGNVIIKGSGDPKLVQERLWLLLRRVQQFGVREIRGDIVLDRSAFSVPDVNPADFDGEGLRPYNARPDALLLNYSSMVLTFTPDAARNLVTVSSEPALDGVRIESVVRLAQGSCGDWRAALKADFSDPLRVRLPGSYALSCGEKMWPVLYADSKNYNARALAGLWREMGGKLTGRVRDGSAPAETPTFEISSGALAEAIRDINKYSNNVMAQQLFFTLASTQRGTGTVEAAREVLRQWLEARLGEDARGAVIDNGSGLSRDTRVTAQLLARLLQVAYASPVMPELMSSLPIGGVDGTARKRTSALGRTHLKTGSLRDVVGVAGYVLADSGKRYVLVAIVNDPRASEARPVLDALIRWTATDAALVPSAVAPAAASTPSRN